MIVTFISQCEKKALIRTRRVLDAFANRIGDKTWQTVITEDGLITVKTLLRKTATKNTAVACHWIRSRSRSDLVWVVGNRDKFNLHGVVPVNSTLKEVIMDISNEKPKPGVLYANTKLQPLAEHLFAVGYVAEQLHRRLMPEQGMFSEAIFVAGCLHDLGKIDLKFQEWVKNPKKKDYIAEDGQHIDNASFSFDKHPRHNEISVLIYDLLDHIDLKSINIMNKNSIKHVIFWHHAKLFRKEKDIFTYGDVYKKISNNLTEINFYELIDNAVELIRNLSNIDIKYRNVKESILSSIVNKSLDLDILKTIDNKNLPAYKNYTEYEKFEKYQENIRENSINNVMRACVVSADRLVSELAAAELHMHVKNGTLGSLVDEYLKYESTLYSQIESCLAHPNFIMNDRSSKQREVARQLANTSGVAVLAGPAGCGKTKIALEWAKLKSAQQIIWVCPRVQICQGLFCDLTSEQYLPHARIEINTGEFKFTNRWDNPTPANEYFFGDVVITTIDQILSGIITHNKISALIDFLNAHVVFDEFHEYINMPAFNLLFAELVECKKQQAKLANILLVSATPHYYYLAQVLGIEAEDVINMPSFNQGLYQFDFKVFDEAKQDSTNPLYQVKKSNVIVISNTALTAQKSFIRNQHQENAVLLHSKFKKSDKIKWFGEVYESFKKDGTRKFDVLRSGPIVQASLNITSDYMVMEISTAEDFLQRLGRLNRFGLNKEISICCIAVPESIHQGKGTGSSARFLSRKFIFGVTKAWYQMLQSDLSDKPVTLQYLYDLYNKFYSSDCAKKFIETDLIASLKASVKLINQNIIDPIIISSKKILKNSRIKISKNSLRGDNRFVQLAIYDVTSRDDSKFIDEYAYAMPINERDDIDSLTMACDEIRGRGKSDQDLLAHMFKKHHNIMGGKKAYKDSILLNEARDPEFPIYLSYTPKDLVQVGGENARHSYAIYYAVCDKQPIGAISIKQLNSNDEE